jgi:hypothetical protein
MKRFGLLGVVLFAHLSMGASPLHADDTSTNASLDMQFGTHAGFCNVFEKLKAGAASEDEAVLAKVMNFPLRVHVGGKKLTIKSQEAFMASYEAIMRPSIMKAIERASYGGLMVNSQSAMIGDGEVWIGSRCIDKACSRSKVGIIMVQEVRP